MRIGLPIGNVAEGDFSICE